MKPLLDLEHADCKWPIGDPKRPDFGFCGAPRQQGKPYCAGHHKLAYMPKRGEPWVPGASKFSGETMRGELFMADLKPRDVVQADCVEAFASGGVR